MYAARLCRVLYSGGKMEALKKKIADEGQAIGTEILKVDNFLNHQMDVKFLEEVGKEFARRFDGVHVDRILTVEASGIAIACLAASYFDYPPVVFAKKAVPSTLKEGFYEAIAKSFTKGTMSKFIVSEKFIHEGEDVLIIDDFLASGEASIALSEIVEKAGANVAGVGAVIEKGHQGGSERLRKKGYRVESLAVVKELRDGKVFFE